MNRPGWNHSRIQFDLSKCAFIARDVLMQNGGEGFRLLRAEVDTLKISDLHLRFTLLLQGSEYQEEIPNVHSDLHAIGIVFPIIGSIYHFYLWLRWNRHAVQCSGSTSDK